MTGMHVRPAYASDVSAVARIGRASLPQQYEGFVDAAAIEATIEQSYSVSALTACIDRCGDDSRAHFLVAELEGKIAGFLHFDSLGQEPELHRLYVSDDARSGGIGSLLIEALHDRIPPSCLYMGLVLSGNDRAVEFYLRHGISVDKHVDGLTYYREHMGIEFPAGTRPFTLLLMRRDPPNGQG
ncbi:MAG: GNAT family N-acetyltransferase [Solirubrobacterales bacterium]